MQALRYPVTINGDARAVTLEDPRVTLLDRLREPLALPGTRTECVRGQSGPLHRVQGAALEHDGFRCGYCTPGQITSAVGVMAEGRAGDTPERIHEGMSGNLCRCAADHGHPGRAGRNPPHGRRRATRKDIGRNQFGYSRPASVAEAIAAWQPGAVDLGGTNLVDLMKTGALRPDRLIDLGHLPGLNRIGILPDGRSGARPRLCRQLPHGGRGPAVGRLGPVAQCRHGRRYPDAAARSRSRSSNACSVRPRSQRPR